MSSAMASNIIKHLINYANTMNLVQGGDKLLNYFLLNSLTFIISFSILFKADKLVNFIKLKLKYN